MRAMALYSSASVGSAAGEALFDSYTEATLLFTATFGLGGLHNEVSVH